ncbi:MED14-domain-containing protein [Xylona heveae TC161]|uniref:Mediator of RNA polymerase II transcription subunit 14 n=1 Tax=Xylona heveae (strain CBS 132557 / TC161) TaxID=1328760 RepID=A0A165GMC9_XYLHT|nr:MED14-domain-containing protein [Xylona heveae TC161]KZF22367.1 MED14-domain-containing protein [Xylona heveae TC161]
MADGLKGAPNGAIPNGDVPETTGLQEAPAEIEHITMGYQPLSRLVSRLAQETFNNLGEVVNAMSELTVSKPAGQMSSAYGNHVNGNANVSAANVEKKMLLMRFAQARRDQFIKTLVLSQWSRQAGDVSKAIDLKVWLDRQRALYEEAGAWMGELKRNLEPAKMPNPDLRTALEVLSTGKASWMPDLGYLPPDPLTPEEMLKTLRKINTLLSIRLNLEETLPPHFKTFTVADGRATFTVPSEFEVDVSIAEEDSSSQFYFIDFRFLFKPSPTELPDGRIRAQLEGKANDVLKNEGLAGLYLFLHEFVLTHKIGVLRRQALEMSRGNWTESVRLEIVRRTLVLQYWTNRPGGKSWIEIGIKSGRLKEGKLLPGEESTSYLDIRWMRENREVKEIPITFDSANLSMEAILNKAIALHTTYILSSMHSRLSTLALFAQKSLALSLSTSDTEPMSCSLQVQLTATETATILVEPTTGRFALNPPSLLFGRAEYELNRIVNPAADAFMPIANLRCLAVEQEVETRARCVGWKILKTMNLKQEEMKRIFPRDTLRISFFRRDGWLENFILAVSISMAGEIWWIAEIYQNDSGYSVNNAIRIPIRSETPNVPPTSYSFLCRLEGVAASMISHYVNTRDLARRGVAHSLRPPSNSSSSTSSSENSSLAGQIPTLFVQLSSLLCSPESSLRPTVQTTWAKDVLRISYSGTSIEDGKLYSTIEARLKEPLPGVDIINDRLDEDVVFHPKTGAFAFQLKTPVGTSIIDPIITRLKRIGRLTRFVDVVRRIKLKCETISLSRIVFVYNTTPLLLKADIGLGTDGTMSLNLDKGNPHLLIKDFLLAFLNNDNGLEHVTLLLRLTAPLVLALDKISRNVNAIVLPRSIDHYHVRYSNPPCTISIRLRQRRDENKWFISDASDQNTLESRKPEFKEALKDLFMSDGPDWKGLRTGIATGMMAVGDVLDQLDNLVRRFQQNSPPTASDAAGINQTATAGKDKPGPNAKGSNPQPNNKKDNVVVLD